ncbi:hypothetical protein ASPBRDRAFT_32612 [Aspergillus brasiliensis CBS 101740]|uniref:AAA+ ATPase domain-containing protein n=1 Tax=Aspergillus brasiliensis (strain CBS 101740 / IMI 381727 / IBT 21946) TaxID=767769 RepID=A0A1L9UB54_ASPBC|nr:hypothetical protein ASPBRDRAFT_32612 [Aspergillus brasiliensis CBS 101740]
MTLENADVHDNDGQPGYTQQLEERLAALEKRILDLERGYQELPGAIEDEQQDRADGRESQDGDCAEASDDGQADGDHDQIKPMIPPFPPTLPEARIVDGIQTSHHAMSAPNIPAIELVSLQDTDTSMKAIFDGFKSSLQSATPTNAMKLIEDNYAKQYKPDISIGENTYIVILSKPLSQLLCPIIYDHTFNAAIAHFDPPLAAPIHYHDKVKSKFMEMEKEQTADSAIISAHITFEDSKLLEEFRAYIRLMDEQVIPFCSSLKTKTAADNTKVYWRNLWHLFVPGETIYYPGAKHNPSTEDYEKLQRSRRPDQRLWRVYTRRFRDEEFWVKAYCIDYDGQSYVCVKEWFCIEEYSGKISPSSLKVYPIRFASNADKIMDAATASGRSFLELRDAKLLAHSGWSFVPERDETSAIYVSGDVVIDFEETFKAHPNWKPISKLPSTYVTDHAKEDTSECTVGWYWIEGQELKEHHPMHTTWEDVHISQLTKSEYCHNQDPFLSSFMDNEPSKYALREEDLHLLPSRLFGYSLQDRMFVSMKLENLRKHKERGDNFRNLIIDPHHERMLRALVESHFRQKDIYGAMDITATNQDIVQSKGRGLIILLHGVPGVGKTSTAETIASDFGKPLLPITCGNLGLDPGAVESSLKEIFRVAQQWDCILLLDEADVFLSERVLSDLSRNALVSVFLRVLDYYSGVLFLTTNRVGTVDEAFKSRIHISLYYPYLGLEQTKKIWEVNLNRLEVLEKEQKDTRDPLSIDRQGILEFAAKHYNKSEHGKGRWNGRQIRNAFLIARALAHYEKAHGGQASKYQHDLNAEHFKTVVKAGIGFEKYLLATKGKTDEESAWLSGTRADHVHPSESGDKPRPAASMPVQPANPPVPPAWTNQYPQPSHAPPQSQYPYAFTHPSPGHNTYSQPSEQQNPYAMGNLHGTFTQPPMAPQARNPTTLSQANTYETGWNKPSNDDWDV